MELIRNVGAPNLLFSDHTKENLSKKVKEILIENRDGRRLMHNEKITEAGFSFLLRPPPVQVVPYAVFDRVEDPC